MLKHLITYKSPKSNSSEAFRILRTNLQFSMIDNNIKSILFTSSMPGDGKSTILSNLAITLSQSGKKVVILDCDLRRPTIHKIFGLPSNPGVTNLIIRGDSIENYIISSDVPNLYVIPSGPIPPTPSELLHTDRMRKIIETLENSFDIVLIDTPPVLAVTDAQILSTIVKGVIIVTAYSKVEKVALIKTKELLAMVNARILGVVLNKVPQDSDVNYYGKKYNQDYYSK